jgi:uncharacterized delta-60 repeat protein
MTERANGRRLIPIALVGAALCFSTIARASGDSLDPSFGEGGAAVTREASGVVTGLVEDRQHRLVAAGVSDSGFVLARYRPNGSLDPSFIGGSHLNPGIVSTGLGGGGGAYGVALQGDGKIVVTGANSVLRESSGVVLARYLPDGKLDPAFGSHGLVRSRLGRLAGAGQAVALQKDDRIVVGGFVGPLRYPGLHRPNPSGLLIRYLANGSIDHSFGNDGQLRIRGKGGRSVAITDVVVLASGKILAAGNYGGRFLLARLLPDGRLDSDFGGGDGKTVTKIGHNALCEACPTMSSLAVAKSGEIVIAGSTGGNSALAAYDSSGNVDRGFAGHGIVRLKGMSYFGAARDVIITHDGRIVVAGGSEFGPRVLRFLSDGEADDSFAEHGVYSHSFQSFSQACAILEQPSGRLVVGGRADQPLLPEEELSISDAQFLLFGLRPN